MTSCWGSGSANPCLWLMDPAIFVIDLQDANKKLIEKKVSTTEHSSRCHKYTIFLAVFRIHDILLWIRIRKSMPLTNGSGSCYFRQLTFMRPTKNYLQKKVFLLQNIPLFATNMRPFYSLADVLCPSACPDSTFYLMRIRILVPYPKTRPN